MQNNNTSNPTITDNSTDATVKVFAYGSISESIFGKRPAILNGFRIFMRGWPSVQRVPGKIVRGIIIDLTHAEWRYLNTEAQQYGDYHFFDADVWAGDTIETVKVLQMTVDADDSTELTSDRL